MNSSATISQAVFCVYDVIFKRDIRVELYFPGKVIAYAIDDSLKKDNLTNLEWACAFVSSVVRSFHALPDKGVCIKPPLKSIELYKYFMECARAILTKSKFHHNVKDFNLGL